MRNAWLANANGGWVNAKYVVSINPVNQQPGVWLVMAELENGNKVQLHRHHDSHREASDAISDLLDGIL